MDAQDEFGPCFVGNGAGGLRILQVAVEIGLLQIDTGVRIAEHGAQGVQIGAPVLSWNERNLRIRARTIGLDGLNHRRVCGGRDQRAIAFAVAAHRHGFRGGGGAVVHGGVGGVHAGQLTDHGLVFKNGLQDPLADFRLIGGVGGQKFFLIADALHNRGDIVVVCASAAEDGVEHVVFIGQRTHLRGDFHLREAGGEV